MPLFEYCCARCKTSKELLRTLNNLDEDIMCPECNEKMSKVISTGNFVLKGSGWAKDGYK